MVKGTMLELRFANPRPVFFALFFCRDKKIGPCEEQHKTKHRCEPAREKQSAKLLFLFVMRDPVQWLMVGILIRIDIKGE